MKIMIMIINDEMKWIMIMIIIMIINSNDINDNRK